MRNLRVALALVLAVLVGHALGYRRARRLDAEGCLHLAQPSESPPKPANVTPVTPL